MKCVQAREVQMDCKTYQQGSSHARVPADNCHEFSTRWTEFQRDHRYRHSAFQIIMFSSSNLLIHKKPQPHLTCAKSRREDRNCAISQSWPGSWLNWHVLHLGCPINQRFLPLWPPEKPVFLLGFNKDKNRVWDSFLHQFEQMSLEKPSSDAFFAPRCIVDPAIWRIGEV